MAASLLGCSCTDGLDPATQASSSGSGGSTSSSTAVSSTSASTGSGSGLCDPKPTPQGVPDAWVEYLDWSCECRFYVPSSKDVLPPPIQWEPCPALPNGIVCQVMVIDWPAHLAPIALSASLDRNPDGTAVLGLTRNHKPDLIAPLQVFMVADADGPVRTAIIKSWVGENAKSLPGCWLVDYGVKEGKHLLNTLGHQAGQEQSKHEGAIGGPIDDLHPNVMLHEIHNSPYSYGWAFSNKWVVQNDDFVIHAYPWGYPLDILEQIFVTSKGTDPENLDFSQPVMKGDALFWTTSNNYLSGINSWNPVDGFRPFVRFVGDPSRGAGNLGTDGIDLVWSYGEQRMPGEQTFPVRSVMTAKFTTDPAALQPKRLRSQPSVALAEREWQVGCGYAAHEQQTDMMVVRLSDGVSWLFPLQNPNIRFYHPIGLTCEEVFFLIDIDNRVNLARVRLDSLGPGIPPD